MRLVAASSTLVCCLVLAACASDPPVPSAPDWVVNPTSHFGFAAADCVKSAGNVSVERQLATARARAEIAKQIEIRVSAMDKTYSKLSEEKGQPVATTAFEGVSKQVTEQTLQGASVTKAEYVPINSVQHLCVLMEVDETRAKNAFTQLVQAATKVTGREIDGASNEILYHEFVGAK